MNRACDSLRRRGALSAVYGLTGLGLAGSATVGSWPGWLVWPAASCLLLSACYATGSTRPLWRRDGRLHPLLRLVLAPVLLGVKGNILLWTWREVPACEVSSGVWLGRVHTAPEARRFGFRSVVNLAAECDPAIAGAGGRTIPVLDHVAPTSLQIREAIDTIEQLHPLRPTLVCCALGYSRSATVAAAWLVAQGMASHPEEAVEALRKGPRRLVITSSHDAALQCWEQEWRRE